jgi:hypothetical protein
MNIHVKDKSIVYTNASLKIATELIERGDILYVRTDDDTFVEKEVEERILVEKETDDGVIKEYETQTVTVNKFVLTQKNVDAAYEYVRQMAYAQNADPVFFKYQRGDCEEQDWIDAVEKIKTDFATPTI